MRTGVKGRHFAARAPAVLRLEGRRVSDGSSAVALERQYRSGRSFWKLAVQLHARRAAAPPAWGGSLIARSVPPTHANSCHDESTRSVAHIGRSLVPDGLGRCESQAPTH